MSEEGKQQQHHHIFHHHHQPEPTAPPPQQPQQYGTFHGVPSYPPPPQPAIGFPQPAPPPGAISPPAGTGPTYYAHGYQAVPGSSLGSFLLLFHGMLEHLFCYAPELITEKNLDMLLAQLLLSLLQLPSFLGQQRVLMRGDPWPFH